MSKKRFIAGAVCPRCGKMDKLVVYLEDNRRECVSCGYGDDRPGDSSIDSELKTRVTRASARHIDTPAQPVKIVDFKKD